MISYLITCKFATNSLSFVVIEHVVVIKLIYLVIFLSLFLQSEAKSWNLLFHARYLINIDYACIGFHNLSYGFYIQAAEDQVNGGMITAEVKMIIPVLLIVEKREQI